METKNNNLISVYDLNNDDGSHLKLKCVYVLWSHDVRDSNWISSYKKLCTIRNVSDFWRLFNNFKKIGWKFMHFYLMKRNIEPVWEHKENKDGGIFSFRVNLDDDALDIWEDVSVKLMCGLLCEDDNDINGISINPKNNWALVKIWNKNSENDLLNTLNPDFINPYKALSLQYKAHKNKPGYSN